MPDGSFELIVSLLVVVAVVFLGKMVVKHMRGSVLSKEEEAGSPLGFSLNDLRQMFSEGKITSAEYERAREKMAKKLAEAMKPKPPPTPLAADPALNPLNPPNRQRRRRDR